MRKVRGKNTAPEKKVRSFLHSLGYRFRLHRNDLPGTPDIVLPKFKIAIFVHGCFWHGHANGACKRGKMPKSHTMFWVNKIKANQERDSRVLNKLAETGWNVLVVWECEIKSGVYREKLEQELRGLKKQKMQDNL